MTISAHLNGGPYDDQCRVVEHPEYRVPLLSRLSLFNLSDADPISPTLRIGIYRMRLDGLGQPVPHDLTGVIEFDYQMDKS